MQYYATISAFTMLGANHLAATVRTTSPEGATEPVLMLSIDVPDDGEPDALEWLAGALTSLLEECSNAASHAL